MIEAMQVVHIRSAHDEGEKVKAAAFVDFLRIVAINIAKTEGLHRHVSLYQLEEAVTLIIANTPRRFEGLEWCDSCEFRRWVKCNLARLFKNATNAKMEF